MGAIFRVNVIVSSDIIKTLKELKKHKFKILATSLVTSTTSITTKKYWLSEMKQTVFHKKYLP